MTLLIARKNIPTRAHRERIRLRLNKAQQEVHLDQLTSKVECKIHIRNQAARTTDQALNLKSTMKMEINQIYQESYSRFLSGY